MGPTSPVGRPRSLALRFAGAAGQCAAAPTHTLAGQLYRVDYDDGRGIGWDWTRVGPSFHEFNKFGVLEFE